MSNSYKNNNKNHLAVDNKRKPIIRGLSQHHISFTDKTKRKKITRDHSNREL